MFYFDKSILLIDFPSVFLSITISAIYCPKILNKRMPETLNCKKTAWKFFKVLLEEIAEEIDDDK